MRPITSINVDHGTSRLRLRTIIRLRWIAVIGQGIAVIIVYWGLGFELPIGPCFAAIALSAWLNILLRLRYSASQWLNNTYATLMLSYDLLQLTVLLYLTGGMQNPFAFLMLVPVMVAASTQPPKSTLTLAILAVILTILLVEYSLPLPWHAGQRLELPFLYRIGVCLSVISGIVFVGLYAWRIAKEAHQMSNALAATETVLAREQKLSALDGMAAAAAHELGTPLSTISVIAKELARDIESDSPLHEDVSLLLSQTQRCRDIMESLTDHSGESDVILSQVALTHLIQEVVEPHRALGANISIEAGPKNNGLSWESLQEPVVIRNSGIIYGLGNLIENAADFAQTSVTIRLNWDEEEIIVQIEDDGPGFSTTVLEHLGEPYISTRSSSSRSATNETIGMGLGIFIAKTLLERFGAKIDFLNKEFPDSGAIVIIKWPRTAMDVGNQEIRGYSSKI